MSERTFEHTDAAMAKAMRRERDIWQRRHRNLEAVALAASQLVDCAKAYPVGSPEWTVSYESLLKSASTWRAFLLRRVPTEWTLAPDPDPNVPAPATVAPVVVDAGQEIDDSDIPW